MRHLWKALPNRPPFARLGLGKDQRDQFAACFECMRLMGGDDYCFMGLPIFSRAAQTYFTASDSASVIWIA